MYALTLSQKTKSSKKNSEDSVEESQDGESGNSDSGDEDERLKKKSKVVFWVFHTQMMYKWQLQKKPKSMIKTVLNVKINSKIQLLQNRWMCSKVGCSSDHCFVHLEHSDHFPLGHEHFAVWAAAWVLSWSFLYQFANYLCYSWLFDRTRMIVSRTWKHHPTTISSTWYQVINSMNCLHCFSITSWLVTNQLLATQPLQSSTSISLQNYLTCFAPQMCNQLRNVPPLRCKINTFFSSLVHIMALTSPWMISVLRTSLVIGSERGCMKMAI